MRLKGIAPPKSKGIDAGGAFALWRFDALAHEWRIVCSFDTKPAAEIAARGEAGLSRVLPKGASPDVSVPMPGDRICL